VTTRLPHAKATPGDRVGDRSDAAGGPHGAVPGTGVSADVVLGNPRFRDADLHALAAREGAAAAWRAAFARHGPKAPAQVDGDFAVAVSMPAGAIYLAVDRFAIQTLCYRTETGMLRAAARADQLAGPDAGLDLQALFDYLYFHVIPSPRTVYRDVFRLPPGHCAHFANGALSVAPYWTPQFREGRGESFASLREEFLRLVRAAVERRIDARPLGCYLSGGTDSSTVSGMATRVLGRPVDTYSIGFDVEGYDEMSYARIAARHFGTRHHEHYVTPDDLVRGMPLVAASYDQPFGNSSAVPAYYCALAARGDGLERLLAGDGGDELFGGNSRYAKQRVFGAWDAIPAPLRRGIAEPLVDAGLFDHIPLAKKGASYVRQARMPMPDRLQTYNLLDRIGGPAALFTPAFLTSVDGAVPERDQRAVWDACDPSASLVNRMLAYDWRYTLAENDLPKVVGSARLAGMDVGFPFLDDALLEFSLSLPTSYKLRGLKLRWFFKEALRGFLPDEILAKKKHGFGLPFGPWAVGHPKLRELARESAHSLATRGLVRGEQVDTLLDTHLPAHPGFYGEMVWVLTMLEQWLRAHAPGFAVR
jgi:asparagine synthase (glutamine-hydrolysing)